MTWNLLSAGETIEKINPDLLKNKAWVSIFNSIAIRVEFRLWLHDQIGKKKIENQLLGNFNNYVKFLDKNLKNEKDREKARRFLQNYLSWKKDFWKTLKEYVVGSQR